MDSGKNSNRILSTQIRNPTSPLISTRFYGTLIFAEIQPVVPIKLIAAILGHSNQGPNGVSFDVN